jgi:hypothetical protein
MVHLMLRWDTMFLVGLMAVTNLKQNFYIETVFNQLVVQFGEATATQISNYFNVAFPLLALFSTPMAMYLFARCKGREYLYMSVVSLLLVAFCCIQLLPSAVAQYVAATLFGPSRTIQWAAYFHIFQNPARCLPTRPDDHRTTSPPWAYPTPHRLLLQTHVPPSLSSLSPPLPLSPSLCAYFSDS